jgi:tRNA nucleotidyltransferase/poly(A) polymerase
MSRLPGLEDGRLRNLESLTRGPLARALQALNGDGEETRLVGGAVRDLILGLKAEDLDLATTARPDEVIRRAGTAGFKVATPGLSHGTVTLIMDGRTIETTTLREDVETDGRHARVAFGRDFPTDARRRDFTINALSLSPDGRVHDPVGGLDDLAVRRVRFIGDADDRIREDYLRILRFFRFSARFGEGAVDAEGLRAAVRNRLAIVNLSRERVRAEILKLIVAPHAGAVVETMGESGILQPALGFAYSGRFNRAIAIETARGAKTDALLRLAALAAMILEDAERLREKLRLANAEYERIASAANALAGLHGTRTPPPADHLRVLLFSAGRQAARDALFLAEADSGASPDDPAFASSDRFLSETPAPELPLSGSDLIARGVEEGPRVGEVLRRFRQVWVEAGFPSDPDALDRLVKTAIETPRPSGSDGSSSPDSLKLRGRAS